MLCLTALERGFGLSSQQPAGTDEGIPKIYGVLYALELSPCSQNTFTLTHLQACTGRVSMRLHVKPWVIMNGIDITILSSSYLYFARLCVSLLPLLSFSSLFSAT